jgi:hypothetical protein
MTVSDLQLILRRLGLDREGEIFWLSTTPEIDDDELISGLEIL